MKYTFEKIDIDTTKLKYGDKEFEIKRDVNLQKKVQNVYAQARTQMMIDLSKQGITKKDLTIEKKENGKTYYDNANVVEIENNYIEMASIDFYNSICKDYTGMELQELITDIGLTEKETEQFGTDFSKAIMGEVKNPS